MSITVKRRKPGSVQRVHHPSCTRLLKNGEHPGESAKHAASSANLSHKKRSHQSHQDLSEPSFRVVQQTGEREGEGNDGIPLRSQTRTTPLVPTLLNTTEARNRDRRFADVLDNTQELQETQRLVEFVPGELVGKRSLPPS